MPLVRVGPKRQITIPKAISSRLRLEPGDLVEVQAKGGQVLLTPKRVVDRAPAPSLSQVEQRLLNSADTKIRRIRADVRGSKGLTDDEVAVAVKSGLIPGDQAWWWHERWQRREREAERDLRAGKVTRYRTAEALIMELHDAAQVRRRA
jgi:AbrB family looped-hinge helix DNA binding protein